MEEENIEQNNDVTNNGTRFTVTEHDNLNESLYANSLVLKQNENITKNGNNMTKNGTSDGFVDPNAWNGDVRVRSKSSLTFHKQLSEYNKDTQTKGFILEEVSDSESIEKKEN